MTRWMVRVEGHWLLIQADHRFLGLVRLLVQGQHVSIRAMYSGVSSAMHHIFFPPRLEVVALQQNPDGLATADCRSARAICRARSIRATARRSR